MRGTSSSTLPSPIRVHSVPILATAAKMGPAASRSNFSALRFSAASDARSSAGIICRAITAGDAERRNPIAARASRVQSNSARCRSTGLNRATDGPTGRSTKRVSERVLCVNGMRQTLATKTIQTPLLQVLLSLKALHENTRERVNVDTALHETA
jgi:hypothetical protein